MTKPIIVLECGQRPDNLGDVVIHRLLLERLATRGEVVVRRPITPSFGGSAHYRGWATSGRILLARLTGRPVFWVDPPGAFIIKNDGDRAVRRRLRRRGRLLQTLGVRRIRLGVSFMPGASLKRIVSMRYSCVGVRDASSLAACVAANVPARFFPDLLFLQPAPERQTQRATIFLSFREKIPENSYDPDYQSRLVEQLDDLLPALARRHGGTFLFGYQVDEDRAFNLALRTRYVAAFRTEFLDEPVGELSMCDVYSQCEATISNRLHVLLIGAAYGAMPCAVTSSEHEKIVRLFDDAGWTDHLVTRSGPDLADRAVDAVLSDTARERVTATFSRYGDLIDGVLADVFGAGPEAH